MEETMETYTPDTLIGGEYPVVTDVVTILSGQNLNRGALLGKITASGKYILCDSAAVDGSEAPKVILAEDCDASAADKQAIVYLSGAFNQDSVVFGGADTSDTHRAALRDLNIYLKSVA
jgi:hypothetical protein